MAATNAPNSFKDPYWSELASGVESKLDLPKGLLVAIVNRGERSNNDQVSSAGARTPFQIIPGTRNAAINKYGVDPYLSPENAAEVAGRLLQDSLKRNGGDPSAAVAEYHGGTDRANWGPITRSYVQRVMGAVPAPVQDPPPSATTTLPPGPDPMQPTPPGQSTFDRVSAALGRPTESAMSNVLKAYQAGQMPAADAQQFETDVKSGRIMLPHGVDLKSAPSAAVAGGPTLLPAGVSDAYRQGRMNATDKAQLEADIRSGLVRITASGPDLIPGANGQMTDPNARAAVQPAAPSIGEKIIGAGEAALTAATGATTGTVGMMAAGGAELARQVAGTIQDPRGYQPTQTVEQASMQGAQSMTYEPRTQAGQGYVQDVVMPVGQAMVPLMGLAGAFPAAAGAAGASIRPAAQITAAAMPRAVQAVRQGAGALAERVLPNALRPGSGPAAGATATPGTLGSAGAAATDMALQRRQVAADLPVPIKLTTGQAERDPVQLSFEKNTAKDGTLGAPLREHGAEQNARLQQNFEAFIDDTGANAPSNVETGRAVVDKGLVKDAARAKAEYRVKYKAAEAAGEMEVPVSTASLIDHINQSESFNAPGLAPVLGLAQKELVRLGGAELVDGQLVPLDLSLKNMELLRRQINTGIGADVTNATNMKLGVELKGVIDTATDGIGGDLYKAARKSRQRYAQLYEDNAVVADLLSSRKGTADRKVALEDVFRRTVLNGSREDLGKLRRTLQVSGSAEGGQAWKELQGATVRHLLEQATSGAGTDMRGNPILSAHKLNQAVRALEDGGKMEFILGKNGAQQIRDINDLSKFVNTLPPDHSVNTSNSGTVILKALSEAGILGSTIGLPLPVLTGLKQLSIYAKDRKIRQRVNEALKQQTNSNDTVSRRQSVKINDPQDMPLREYGSDYKKAIDEQAGSRLETDIDGRALTAPLIAGRRTVGGPDIPISAAESIDAGRSLGATAREVTAREIGGDAGRFVKSRDASGEVQREILIQKGLDADAAGGVYQHEFSHLIDDLTYGGEISTAGIKKELLAVYHDLNSPFRSGKGKWSPENDGYKGAAAERELMAEGIRAYLRNPNYFKTVAPKAAEKIRDSVNQNGNLRKVIQFNSVAVPIGAGFLGYKLLGLDSEESTD